MIVTLGLVRLQVVYTTLPDWVIKWFQPSGQKWAAFKTHKKCGRRDFPSRLRRQESTPNTRIPPATQAKLIPSPDKDQQAMSVQNVAVNSSDYPECSCFLCFQVPWKLSSPTCLLQMRKSEAVLPLPWVTFHLTELLPGWCCKHVETPQDC